MRPASLIRLAALLPLALMIALPAVACERHLQGHQNGGTGTAQEASQR